MSTVRPVWFTLDDLKSKYPYNKVQNAVANWVDDVIVPDAMRYVENYVLDSWMDPASVPEDLLKVAKNYAVNKILADDENVRIAQARGQASFTIAGNQINLDLSLGRNPLLSPEDEQTLITWREKITLTPHTDRVAVKSQGATYETARDRYKRGPGDDEYIRRDYVLPMYFWEPSRNF